MKILHVIPSLAAQDGGPAHAVRGMATAQARRGDSVSVATTDADGTERLAVRLGTPLHELGVDYLYFRRSAARRWKFSWPLTRWITAHAGEYDVLHVHGMFSYAGIAGCRSAWLRSVPYVLGPLGTLGEWSLAQKQWKKRPYYEVIERAHLARAAAIHATSRAEAGEIARRGYGERARVVELGVDTVVLPKRTRQRTERFRLLFLARLHPVKGIPLLLDALSMALRGGADVELVIAGGGEPAYVSELGARVVALALRDRVHFAGTLSGAAKAEALSNADAFVLPSSHENFGIAAAEALAAGLPVILSDQVGLAPEVATAHLGRILPLDTAEWAWTIAHLSRNRDEAGNMGERAARFARVRYSWERTASGLAEVYREIQSSARGAFSA